MSFKKAFLFNLLAQGWSKGSEVILRLISVPAFIGLLGVEDYGRWLVLSAIPSWLNLADMGFGSVSVNQITMDVAGGRSEAARIVYSTTQALMIAMVISGTALVVLISPIVPWCAYLNLAAYRHREMEVAVIFLGISTLVAMFGSLYLARFQAAGQAHKFTMISSCKPWLDFGFVLSAMLHSKRFDIIAGAALVAQLIYLVVIAFCSRKVLPSLVFGVRDIQFIKLKPLFRQGLSFQALPLGNAFLFQGTLLAVQSTLGPSAVAVYGAARTMIRSINQAMAMFTQAAWPEMSRLMGAKDFLSAAKLHRTAVALSVSISLIGSCGLLAFGLPLFDFWTKGKLQLSWSLLAFLVLSIPLNAVWSTSSVVHVATNQHSGLALRYLIGTILALILTLSLSGSIGLYSVAWATLIVDILLIPYVFRLSLKMTFDSRDAFFKGIMSEIIKRKNVFRVN